MFIAQRGRMVSSLKNTLVLAQRTPHGSLNVRLLPAVSTIHLPQPRGIHVTSASSAHDTTAVTNVRSVGLFEKLLLKYRILDIQKYRYMVLGIRVYEHVANQIDYHFFFTYFNMPDTFVSWFLVTELHVWMIMVRYMAEGKNGQLIRNNVVSALWDDSKARIDKLGTITTKLKNDQVKELSHQFNAAIIGYDEGIQSDDKVLAAALWRRFFCLECNNPEHVETLLIYVRKQICLFDNLPTQEILRYPILQLIDIKSLCNPR